MKSLKKKVLKITFIGGIALLILNIYGILIDPYSEYKYKNNLKNIELMRNTFDTVFQQHGQSEQLLQIVAKISNEYMKYEAPANYEYMPASENWVLFSMRIWDPIISKYLLTNKDTLLFRKVELPDYRHALKRGFGICSQQSLAFADLLWEQYKINARVAGLNGHVVIQVIGLNNTDYILDPSFGVYTAGNVMRPELIDASFFNNIAPVKDIYTSQNDNYISTKPGWSPYSEKNFNKQLILFYFILFSYWFKWLIPIILIAVTLKPIR